MLSGPTHEINPVIKKCFGKFNETTSSKLYNFKGRCDNVIFDNITVPKSFYTKYYGSGNNFPKDSCLLFYVYGTHLNTSDVPCNVCVGCASINIYEIFYLLKKKKKPVKKTIRIKNREIDIGTITVYFDKEGKSINLKTGWHNCKVYSDEKVNEIAHEYAKHEFDWIQLFKKKWSGTEGMMDLFGFMMMGHTIPIAFFLQRNREMTEKEFNILLYFSLRRYSIENDLELKDMTTIFHKLPFIEKCSILTTLLTIVSTSHSYITDYYISREGVQELVETFQSPSKSDSGDCEGK